MLVQLTLGIATTFTSMSIQVAAVVIMIRYLLRIMHRKDREKDSFGFDSYVISMILVVLLFGHLVQIAIWAVLFVFLIMVTYIPWLSTFIPNALMGPEIIIK